MASDRLRLAAWTVSGVCLAGSVGLIVNRHLAFAAAARDESRLASDLQRARDEAQAAARLPREPRFACADPTPGEATAFLLAMRQRARRCGVSITRWSARSTTYAKKDGEKPDESTRLLEGVTKVSCDLGLAGSYPALRAFLADVWDSNRLLTVAHVAWDRTEKGSALSLSLGRYLSPAKGGAKP